MSPSLPIPRDETLLPDTAALEGPWERAFYLILPVPVRSKSNARRYVRGARPRTGDDWNALVAFESLVRSHVTRSLPQDWECGSGDVELRKRPVVVGFVFARTTLDAANLAKSVPDAVQGVVVVNDASITNIATQALRTTADQRGLVAFAQLTPGASVRLQVEASAALQQACLAVLEARLGA